MSLLGKLFSGVKGFVTGGPLGAAQALLSKSKTKPDSIITSSHSFSLIPPSYSSITQKQYGGSIDGGAAGPYGGTQMPTNLPALMGQACPAGFRLNKSTYITRGGGTSRWGPAGSITIHPKASTCVKRRRRNVGNARALRRAISRVKGFVKLARKAHSLVGGGRRKGKTKMIGPGGTSIVNVD